MSKSFQLKPLILSILTACLLTACNSGGSDNSVNNGLNNGLNNGNTGKAIGKHTLVKASSDQNFAAYYKAGLTQPTKLGTTATGAPTPSTPSTAPSTPGTAPAAPSSPSNTDSATGTSSGNYSQTNLIEAGVDQLDFVKQNASHIFTTKRDKTGDNIQVFAKPSTDILHSLSLGKSQGFKGFFLAQDKLFALRQSEYAGKNVTGPNSSQMSYSNGKIKLNTVSISNPTLPSIGQSYTWEGEYKDSRRIGNNVYVISSTWLNAGNYGCAYKTRPAGTPTAGLPGPICVKPAEQTPEQIAQRMPVDINGNKIKPSDCYIPKQYSNNSRLNDNVTLITKVDLSGANNHSTTCVSASAEHVYMSPTSLYLSGSEYQAYPTTQADSSMADTVQVPTSRSVINKFNLTNTGVDYAGTGVIRGTINWDVSSFSMNEHNGVLRVVSSDWTPQGIKNMLHTLRESSSQLELENITTIPNANHPESIGKPNERIKGVRFLGDEGYVVTFEQKDPLYKIDLSSPANPHIVGELEMPGYSAYLHRINDKYLLGLGYSTDENSSRNGIQTTVFDTSGNAPVIVDQHTLKLVENIAPPTPPTPTPPPSPASAPAPASVPAPPATSTSGDSTTTVPVDKAPSPPKDHTYKSMHLPFDGDSRAVTTLIDNTHLHVSVPYIVSSYTYTAATNSSKNTLNVYAIEYDINLTTGKITNKTERTTATYENHYSAFNSPLRALLDNDTVYYSKYNGSLVKYLWGNSN